MMHRGRCSPLGIIAFLALAGSAQAQTRLLSGVVKDSLGVPIYSAAIAIGADVVRTDSSGTFVVSLPRTDSVTIHVRRIGFEQVTFALSVDEAIGNRIEVVLNAIAQNLSAVEVQELEFRAMTILRNFDERRKTGLGVYITREDIERRNTHDVVELLRGQRGVTVDRGGDVRFVRQASRACTPDVYVDGQFTPGLPLTTVLAQDVEGIEVYSGISQLPAEFMRPGKFNCGAIVLWSRRPIVLQTQQKAQTP